MVGIIFLSQISVSHNSPLKKLFIVHWPRFIFFIAKYSLNAMLPIGAIQNCWACSVLKIQKAFCSDQQQLVTWIVTVLCVNLPEKLSIRAMPCSARSFVIAIELMKLFASLKLDWCFHWSAGNSKKSLENCIFLERIIEFLLVKSTNVIWLLHDILVLFAPAKIHGLSL